ncbi:MAG: hybrid sensor histidine kinase/response regulator, partial [Pseudomonadota bacterium]
AAAEEANLGKTRFLAAAGHDILQPLNAARLYTTSLSDRSAGLGEITTQQYADKINTALEGVEDILSAVLDIGRLDTGALKPSLADIPVQSIFDRLEVEFAPLAKEKGLVLRIARTTLHTRSDERLLRRLIQNLLSNAIKYTENGRILLGARRRPEGLTIEVLDTGQGIPEAHKSEVFREFHRLEEGAKSASGLGLGLSIVERISKVLAHPIRLESITGRGTRFVVTLPRVEAPSVVADLPKDLAPQQIQSGNLSTLAVLCIDNEPEILEGMKTLLSGWGCHVLTAANLEDSITAIETWGRPPDGVIADYHLDTGNGIDVIETLRKRFQQDIPSILATADRSRAVQKLTEQNDIHLFRKPLKPAALRALLTQWSALRIAAE